MMCFFGEACARVKWRHFAEVTISCFPSQHAIDKCNRDSKQLAQVARTKVSRQHGERARMQTETQTHRHTRALKQPPMRLAHARARVAVVLGTLPKSMGQNEARATTVGSFPRAARMASMHLNIKTRHGKQNLRTRIKEVLGLLRLLGLSATKVNATKTQKMTNQNPQRTCLP